MRKLKITSLILVAVMLLSMIPFGIFSVSAATSAPATLPNGKAYYTHNFWTGTLSASSGDNYLDGADDKTDADRSQAWRGADGILLTFGNQAAQASLNVQLQFDGNISGSTSSFCRASTNVTDKAWNNYQSYRTYTYTSADGKTWKEYAQGAEGITSSKAEVPATADGLSYLYIPLESFRFFGTGNGSYTSSEADVLARSLVGKRMTEVLDFFEAQNAAINVKPYSAITLKQVDFCYAIEDLSKPTSAVTEDPITFTKYSHEDTASTKVGFSATAASDFTSITTTGMYVDSNNDAARAFIGNDKNTIDLSKAVGTEVYVDTTALGANSQLLYKVRLQRYANPGMLSYATGTIYNAYGTKFNKKDADGNRITGSANNGVYESFNNSDNDTGVYGGYVQYATRSGASVAYITGTDLAGNTYTNSPVYTQGTTYTASTEDAFLLPAGFKGTVYVPMESYWLNIYGSYSSKAMAPWSAGLVTEFNAFGFYSSVKGTPVKNEVVYSNFKVINREVMEINNEEEFTAFATALASGTNYEGMLIKLNADVTYNKGWDAFGTETPATAYPVMTSSSNFAGIFDGQGHVISGIYLSGTDYMGIFGNVNRGMNPVIKNLSVVNSKIVGTGADVGGFFGHVKADSNTARLAAYENTTTSATFENVYIDAYIKTENTTGGQRGIGGFVGEAQSDVFFKDCVVAGYIEATTGRGCAAFIGSMRANFPTLTVNGEAKQVDAYMLDVRFENCINKADVVGAEGWRAGLISYSQGYTANITVKGYTSIGNFYASAADYAAGTKATASGALFGGTWGSASNLRAPAAGGSANSNDVQLWSVSDVKIVGDYRISGQDTTSIKMSYTTVDGTYTADRTVTATAANSSYLPGMATTIDTLPEILMVRDGALQQSVTLTEDLAMNFLIPEYNVITKSDDVKLTLTVDGTANTLTKANGYWSYSVTDILPQEMDKEVTASVTLNGETITKTTSIAAYLKKVLATEALSSVHGLASDLLRYGAAAQKIAGVADDKLVTNGVTLATGSTVPTMSSVNVTTSGSLWTSAALRLENELAIVFKAGEDLTGKTVTATIDGKSVKVTVDGNRAIVYVVAADMDKNVVISCNGSSVTYSVRTYVARSLNNASVSDAHKELIRAVYAYGMSAAAYAAN